MKAGSLALLIMWISVGLICLWALFHDHRVAKRRDDSIFKTVKEFRDELDRDAA